MKVHERMRFIAGCGGENRFNAPCGSIRPQTMWAKKRGRLGQIEQLSIVMRAGTREKKVECTIL